MENLAWFDCRIPFYMSTDCENLLKKFLILNPTKRASLDVIMKDRWMNIGYEGDELQPFVPRDRHMNDGKLIGAYLFNSFFKRQLRFSLGMVCDLCLNAGLECLWQLEEKLAKINVCPYYPARVSSELV